MLLRADAVIDAVVENVVPTTVENTAGKCIWVSEIWIRPVRSLWGETSDSRLRVLTISLPEELQSAGPPPRGCAFTSGDMPPPKAGRRGIFVLGGLADGYKAATIVPGVPVLQSVEYEFLPLQEDGSITIHDNVGSHRLPYEDYSEAIDDEAHKLSIEGMSHEASFIALGTLGSFEERSVSREEPGSKHVIRYPFRVKQVYRGSEPPSPIFITMNTEPIARDAGGENAALVSWTRDSRKSYPIQCWCLGTLSVPIFCR
jgi:hypothetical protein